MHVILFILVAFGLTACDRTPGPDAITSQLTPTSSAVSNCTAICHAPANTNGTPDPLATNGSGTFGKHVAHVTSAGLSCDRCHYGYANDSHHMDLVLNVKAAAPSPVHFDSLNSASATWVFSGPSVTGSGVCSTVVCHTGSPAPLDWYASDIAIPLPACTVCHAAPVGVRRQVLGSGGDFAGNPAVTTHHVAGADPTTDQCKLCHDQYQHMAGTVRLRSASTGTRIDYDPSAPSTLEPFCLGCHNATGATYTYVAGGSPLDPFADGVTLGTGSYVAGTTIASSWNGSSVHRSRGVTCAGNGTPNTGCHGTISASTGTINMHGSTTSGLLANTMNFQIPAVNQTAYTANPLGSSYDANNYRLCFDCHAAYPAVAKEVVLGYRQGGAYDLPAMAPTPYYQPSIQSLFRDRYIANPANYPGYWGGVNQPYNDIMAIFGQPNLPLHNYHLIGFVASFPTPTASNLLTWNYRGNPSQTARIQCTACHNVHGTAAGTVRSTYAELGLQATAGAGGDVAVSLIASVLSSTLMTSAPMHCANDCHGVQGQTYYWHTPSGE